MPEENIKVYTKEKKSSFPILPFLLLIVVAIELAFIYFNPLKLRKPTITNPASQFETYDGVSYEAVDPDDFEVNLFASDIPSLSSLVISPDDKYMLASTLSGKIIVFTKQGERFVRQATDFFNVPEASPGFPEEMGLTGVSFSADFDTTKELFLFYSSKTSEDKLFNHVGRITLEDKGGTVTGINFLKIFSANTEGNVSHQIQRGMGVMIGGKSHVLFTIGEGFQAVQALDQTLESGKVILIQSDGSEPVVSSPRPFPDHKKLQAIGVRNAPVINFDKFDPQKRFMVIDTGAEKYDRLVYLNLLNEGSSTINPISLNWDGTEASLQKVLPDPNLSGVSDMVIYRWNPTITVTNAEVHEGKGKISSSSSTSTSLIMIYFGLTADPTATRGKEIVFATIKRDSVQPTLSLETIIKRSTEASNFAGNPLGLAIEKSGDFYFGDIIEGRIYKVTVK